jgi:ubiquinone/menaquinone biosynthesis C-methylase UbiE
MRFVYIKIKQQKDIEDASWAYYINNFIIREVYLSRLRAALMLAPSFKNQKIADIGVGSGILIPSLANYGEVVGADYNKDSIKKSQKLCKSLNIKCSLVHGKLPGFRYKKNYFDTIFCLSVLEHIKDIPKALESLEYMLKENGTLIIGLPIERFLVNTMFKIMGISGEVDELHVSDYKEIEKELAKKFVIEKTKKLPFGFFPDSFSLYKAYRCRKR